MSEAKDGSLKREYRRRKEQLFPLRLMPSVFWLGVRKFWDRVRQGQGPFAPTISKERAELPKASAEGRNFSDDEYLRPVRHCNCRAPEILALSDKFRAETSGDWEYTEAIYNFCRNQIDYGTEAPAKGVVFTLERGVGDCHEKAAVFAALARAGGLPARFCNPAVAGELPDGDDIPFASLTEPIVESLESSDDKQVRNMGKSARPRMHLYNKGKDLRENLRSHPIVEVKIGESWIPCDPVFSDAEALASDLPLPRFGYDPLLLSGGAAGAFTLEGRQEGLPSTYRPSDRVIGYFFFRGLADIINRHFEKVRQEGKARLEELDEAEYRKQMKRFYVPVPGATPTMPE